MGHTARSYSRVVNHKSHWADMIFFWSPMYTSKSTAVGCVNGTFWDSLVDVSKDHCKSRNVPKKAHNIATKVLWWCDTHKNFRLSTLLGSSDPLVGHAMLITKNSAQGTGTLERLVGDAAGLVSLCLCPWCYTPRCQGLHSLLHATPHPGHSAWREQDPSTCRGEWGEGGAA